MRQCGACGARWIGKSDACLCGGVAKSLGEYTHKTFQGSDDNDLIK